VRLRWRACRRSVQHCATNAARATRGRRNALGPSKRRTPANAAGVQSGNASEHDDASYLPQLVDDAVTAHSVWAMAVLERQLLTVPEVATRLRVSPRTVRRLIDRGLPAVRLGPPGASIRVDVNELEDWLYGDPAAGSSSASSPQPESPDERGDPLGTVDSPAHAGPEEAA
jgi:excisionase family DNA binding protein